MDCEGPITVRAATPDDAFAIAWIHVATWQVAYRGLIQVPFLAGLSVERRETSWRESLVAPAERASTSVALAGERVIGFASVGRSREEGAAPDDGELFAIYVEPACWGAGAGRLLMHRALADLRSEAFRSATLWVLAGNDRAIDFYAKAGWAPDGTQRTEIIDSVDILEIRLARDL
jgi:ribosomal protein S18 acetylase RimI-like enzyme